VRLAAEQGVGIVPQGGNTSYCGGATPDASGRQIIVSLERMDKIREVDPVSMSICRCRRHPEKCTERGGERRTSVAAQSRR
jgi:FAD binding domain